MGTEIEICKLISEKMSAIDMALIPFYSVEEDKEVLLPIDLCLGSTGSNGMCAGNTYREAFLQGLCEIFERYSILNIFSIIFVLRLYLLIIFGNVCRIYV